MGLHLVPPPTLLSPAPDEWDDVLDTSDIVAVEEPGRLPGRPPEPVESGSIDVEVPISLPDLFASTGDWDDPTREAPVRPLVTHESGMFRRFELADTVLDAAVFFTELKRRHKELRSRVRRLETIRVEPGQGPAARAAWGLLEGRSRELGELVVALGALVRVGAERGTLDLFAPSRPLAAWLRAAFDYAESIASALARLGRGLSCGGADVEAFCRRIEQARSWVVPELLEEVHADLALLALQIGDRPVSRARAELRKAALAQADVEVMLEAWIG